MTSYDADSINLLLEDVKKLFKEQQSFVQPQEVSNLKLNDHGYQAPLKGSWHNSGGFNPSAIRTNGRKGHFGVDMRAPGGTSIYPLTSGIVANVGSSSIGGNIINIDHPNNIRSYYAHLSTIKVNKGDKVDKDTVIGTVGDTGNAAHTFPHLHFQVWKDNQIQDPANYFNIPKYTELSAFEKQQGSWLSEQAKQDRKFFNIKEHIKLKNIAFSKDISCLIKCAEQFYKLFSI